MEKEKTYYATLGGPGIGKTTLLKKIVEEYPQYRYAGNDTIIEKDTLLYRFHRKIFSDGQQDYFFRFQMAVLPIRFLQTHECVNNSLVDETIYDALAYTEAERILKWITEDEYVIFKDNFNIMKKFFIKPKAIIYLRGVDPFLLLLRLAKYGRAIEKKFSIEYLDALLESFDKVVYQMEQDGVNVVKIDVAIDDTPDDIFKKVIDKLGLSHNSDTE